MADLAVGATLAGCHIEAVAGRGGMGVVYRARQLELDRLVALKAIAPWLAADGAYRERFKREARLAASIDHPNIIPIYAAGEAEETLYLIMRWVEGIDLRALLEREGRLPPARAIALLEPVASALGAAHRRGLVHRDVKPANVLISTDGEHEHVHLTDFGIAHRRHERSHADRRDGGLA
jgi:serine/threonine protein kinase